MINLCVNDSRQIQDGLRRMKISREVCVLDIWRDSIECPLIVNNCRHNYSLLPH